MPTIIDKKKSIFGRVIGHNRRVGFLRHGVDITCS